MLEYDEKTEEMSNSLYGWGFAIGFAEGGLISTFHLLKILTEKFTDNQIRGLEPAEGDKAGLLQLFTESDRCNLLDFYRKYESFSERRLVKRYISESEYLPWRSF